MKFVQEISIFKPYAIADALSSLGSAIEQTDENIRAYVYENYLTADEVNNQISNITSEINLSARSIDLEVSARTSDGSGRVVSAYIDIALKDFEGGVLDSVRGEINLNGLVSFTNLSGSNRGTTVINGDNISAGSIHDAGNNTVLNLTDGTLTIKKGSITLGSNFAVTTAGVITAKSGVIGGWNINGDYGLYTNNKTSATSTNTGILIQKAGNIYAGAYDSGQSSCPFQVTSAGVLTARSGKIGGFTIANAKLSVGTLGSQNSVHIGASNLGSASIAGTSLSTWRLTIGANFGVTNTGALYASGANISGAITATSLTIQSGASISGLNYSSLSGKPTIPSKTSQLTNDSGYQNASGVTTIVNGTVTTDYVNALSITAGSVACENLTGTTITGKSFVANADHSGDIQIGSGKIRVPWIEFYRYSGGAQYFASSWTVDNDSRHGNNNYVRLWNGKGIRVGGDGAQVTSWFGTGVVFDANCWFYETVFNSSGNVEFYSDERRKQNVIDIPNKDSLRFILNLKPKKYEYKAKPGIVKHGFIAQDVQQIVKDNWHIVGQTEDEEGDVLTLAYGELYADIVGAIQALNQRIEALERMAAS